MFVPILAILDVEESVALVSADGPDDRLGKFAALRDRFEPFNRRLDRAPADLEFFLPLVPALEMSRIRETEFANHPWQREAFADEGHEDHAEGQNQDEIAVREWTPVSDRERDRKRRGERDDAADSREGEKGRMLPRR